MKKVTKPRRNPSRAVLLAMTGLVGGILAPALPVAGVSAATSPSITLSQTTLAYGYSAPLTIMINGTGTDFVQGGTVVYVMQGSTDTHTATNFQVSSPTNMSFSLGGGLANPGSPYTVEVETPSNSAPNGLETETASFIVNPAPSVSSMTIGGNSDSAYLGVGYPDTSITIETANANLSTQTQALVEDSNGNLLTGKISGLQVNAAAQSATFTLSGGSNGLSAGNYTLILRTNGQDVTAPITIRNPQSAVTSATLTANKQQTVTFDAVNANFTAGNVKVTVGGHIYTNVTVVNKNEVTFNILAGDFPTAGSQSITVQDNSESFTENNYFNFVAAGSPTATATPTTLQDGYSNQSVSIATTGLTLNGQTTVKIQQSGTDVQGKSVTNATAQGSTEVVTLPSGLAVGNYDLVVTDQSGNQAQATFSVTGAPPTTITASSQWPTGIQGQSYGPITLTANGTGPAYTWSIVKGSPPAGLSLDSSKGTISGTLANTATSSSFTVQAANQYGSTQEQFTINVSALPAITTTTLASATVGQSYRAQFEASGTTPITWSVSSNNLPAGLNLDHASGVISGTPTSGAQSADITVQATNSDGHVEKQFHLTVNPASTVGSGQSGGSQQGGSQQGGSQQGGSQQGGSQQGGSQQGGSQQGGSQSGGNGSTGNTDQGGKSQGNQSIPVFGSTLATQNITNAGGDIHHTYGNNAVTVQVPAGAFHNSEQLSLTTTNVKKLASVVPSGSTPIVALGVNFTGATPNKPITLTIKNPLIPANAQIFKIRDDGSLQFVKSTAMSGQVIIKFSSDPKFVVVKPIALVGHQRAIELNGKSWIVPGMVQHYTTYMPTWYVMNALKAAGIASVWDGQNWRLTSSQPADLSHLRVGTGNKNIWLNGALVERLNGFPALDPNTHRPTMYMPIWYVMQALERVGLTSAWDGDYWVIGK